MKIAEETLGGIDVEVHVRPTTGQFTFEIPGEGHRTDVIGYGDDLLTARAHARDTLKKRDLKTAIPFINSRNGERGIATGIHSTSRNILVRWEDGGSEQLSSPRALRPDTPAEIVTELLEARSVVTEAERKVRTIEREWALDLLREVEAERTAKLEASRTEVSDG